MLDETAKARIIHYLKFEPNTSAELEPWQNEIDDDIEQLASDFTNRFDHEKAYSFLHSLILDRTFPVAEAVRAAIRAIEERA